MTTQIDDDHVLIYEAAWKKAEVFFEWRHKLMAFSVTVVGAGLVAAGWLINNDADHLVVAALLFFLAAVVFMTRLMDARVGAHMKDAYRAGAFIEERLRKSETALIKEPATLPFEALLHHRTKFKRPSVAETEHIPNDPGSLSHVLKWGYTAGSLLLAVASLSIGTGLLAIDPGDKPQKVELVRPAPTP